MFIDTGSGNVSYITFHRFMLSQQSGNKASFTSILINYTLFRDFVQKNKKKSYMKGLFYRYY